MIGNTTGGGHLTRQGFHVEAKAPSDLDGGRHRGQHREAVARRRRYHRRHALALPAGPAEYKGARKAPGQGGGKVGRVGCARWPRPQRVGWCVDTETGRAAVIGRLDRRGRLLWSLPKGHVEQGETVKEAAVREVAEETGIDSVVVAALGSIDYWFVAEDRRVHKTVHHFLLRAVGGELSDADVEVTEVAWVPLADMPARLGLRRRAPPRPARRHDARGLRVRPHLKQAIAATTIAQPASAPPIPGRT